jgi:hypothetical protein
MFVYTPKAHILRRLAIARAKPRGWDNEWFVLDDILGTTDYTLKTMFKVHYEKCNFSSPTKRNEVPLNGYLYPVELFDEKEI